MIPVNDYTKVKIHITTYKKQKTTIEVHEIKIMNEEKSVKRNKTGQSSKFICSVCLNNKPVCDEKNNKESERAKPRACPICQRSFCSEKSSMNRNCYKNRGEYIEPNEKVVQTSQTDITQGMNLLNEVLTVFQSKKQTENLREKSCKTAIFKDASVATDFDVKNADLKPKLTLSKVFQFSIEEETRCGGNTKFVVVNSCQPQVLDKSSINLKHKSSSIPQMKLEELMNSLKDKTKSEDTIGEVNRMFATVRKYDKDSVALGDTNRPLTRNGPRVLPVVKTNNYNENHNQCSKKRSCKCCQTNSLFMSAGDSFRQVQCCHNEEDKTYGNCVCRLGCNNEKNYRSREKICEYCGTRG